ncbi:MAG TPA: hypothetical protein PK825_08075 [Bacteroidales bacterium]|nr:hypothetical protein [Bacteroidales bacterium]
MNRSILCIIFFVTVSSSFADGQKLVSYNEIHGETVSLSNPVPVFEFRLKWAYTLLQEEIQKIDESEIRPHALGKEVAARFYLFENSYCIRSQPVPGSFSEKVTYKKPAIYQSVKKIDRYYRKNVRENQMPLEIARDRMLHILEVAILLLQDDTGEFEKELVRASNAEKMAELFMNVKMI